MATLAELTRQYTTLDRDELHHLQDLIGEWGLLADLCFSDLLLYVPTDGSWMTIAQVRPVTAQTLYHADWVGTPASAPEAAALQQAYDTGATVEIQTEVEAETRSVPVRMEAIPVRFRDRSIAVLTREWSPEIGRQPGELEQQYLAVFERMVSMILAGAFPFRNRHASTSAAPRVGDGAMVLSSAATVQFASPNALSALHRVGITANVIGMSLAELGFNDAAIRASFERREPVLDEFEQSSDITFLIHCIPLLDGGEVCGALVLVRDVSELRRRDRMLLSKDATIREIHHRVKNNLQTISSLLRLQSRRLSSAEAKAAVNESVRRIRTIALVHETLSREAGDDVAFTEIVRPLLRLAEESLQSPDRPMQFSISGDGGKLPAIVATPLSVVLTELLQNAVDHGFPEHGAGGRVNVHLANDGKELTVRVVDDGLGVPHGFSLDSATGLGLVIVRTLVTTELAGTIDMRPATGDDLADAGLSAPTRGTGTLVEVHVPLDPDAR